MLILIGIACGIVAQLLFATGPGFATSVFLGGLGLSSTVGGLVGSIGVARLGLPHVFFPPAITGGIALIGMTVLFMKTPLLRHRGTT